FGSPVLAGRAHARELSEDAVRVDARRERTPDRLTAASERIDPQVVLVVRAGFVVTPIHVLRTDHELAPVVDEAVYGIGPRIEHPAHQRTQDWSGSQTPRQTQKREQNDLRVGVLCTLPEIPEADLNHRLHRWRRLANTVCLDPLVIVADA